VAGEPGALADVLLRNRRSGGFALMRGYQPGRPVPPSDAPVLRPAPPSSAGSFLSRNQAGRSCFLENGIPRGSP
jgi:hypothetical protein